nr:MAG: ORF1 [TTV-like mini virus]UGV37385.1 MAG: ORF1 [TTV-like mini virus]UGV37456.1 MAG: ORF1 [TTV-like mini virus]UGV37781.1 MAG: ORF1 [TTV-like mini virus]UGV38523.1 MAG: ORF1 [TTV-like mini virus]
MPFYQRRWNPWRYKRFRWRRRRRFRRPFRTYRRRRWVRKYKRNFKRKLTYIPITQFQPSHIRNVHIRGMFPVFQAGKGHFSNNYSMYRESYVPEHQPGGGGWNIFCFNLNNLYSEHKHMLNWWNVSNKHLNLVKYRYVTFKLYRQQFVDWVFTYQRDHPMEVTKYHYPSTHPQRMLMYHHKIIVPSYQSAPHKKKPYIKIRLKPPNEMINKWYFQQQFASYNLIMCTAVACSLNNMFINPGAQSNNITLLCLNTKFFTQKNFEYPPPTTGYRPNSTMYQYGDPTLEYGQTPVKENAIYLGNSEINTEGIQIKNNSVTSYGKNYWGNPFYHRYLKEEYLTYISNKPYTELLANNGNLTDVQIQIEPKVFHCRYNPLKDTGEGNEVYWLNTHGTEQGWDTIPDPDLVMRGFPLWLMLWGWEDWTRKLGKAKKLDEEWVLVIKSRFIEPKLPAYVALSESFVNGNAPYNQPPSEIDILDSKKWYPRWLFQKEAIENLLMSGPSVCKAPNIKNIQAHLQYDFSLKWGGNPAYIESITDPAQQPIYPSPIGNLLSNEINNPESSIYNELYNFDIRRDMLTKKAIDRLTKDSSSDYTLFTDGTAHSTFEPPIQGKEKSQETTPPKEAKTSTENNLQLIELYNQQLQHRIRKLKSIIQTM